MNKKNVIKGILILLVCVIGFSIYEFKTTLSSTYQDGKPVELNNLKYNDHLFNVLCLGLDKQGDISKSNEIGYQGQADAIYLVSIDTETKKVFVNCIPRDTMVDVKIYNQEGKLMGINFAQITLQHAYGSSEQESIEYMAQAVSKLLGNIPIHRYAVISYDAIPSINDAIGGVDVVMEDEVDTELQVWSEEFRPGNTVHLDGFKSYYYLRERNTNVYASCEERANRQKTYIQAYLHKVKHDISPSKYFSIYKEVKKSMVTNISMMDMLALIPYIKDMEVNDIYTLPGTRLRGAQYEEYHTNPNDVSNFIRQLYYSK